MPKNREEYVIALNRPAHISVEEMQRHIREAIKKMDTTHKDFTKEVMCLGEIVVYREPHVVAKAVANGQ